MHGFRAGGVVGWMAWGFVHLTFLTGFLNRFSALFHWLRRIVSKGRSELAYTARFNQPRPRTKTS
jgi:NADH dehydrogenase